MVDAIFSRQTSFQVLRPTHTLSSFGALVSSFIKASTIGLDMERPFMAANFKGPIGPDGFSSYKENIQLTGT